MITWCIRSILFNVIIIYTFLIHVNALNNESENFLTDTKGIKYHNYEAVTKLFKNLTERYPKLARLHTVGTSVEGRELWVIEISENVSNRSLLKPMFKFVANMHGDETVGRELMIYLAQYLLENYGTNDRVTKLLNKTDVFLMPSMNPDGFEHSVEGGCETLDTGAGRENANFIDLNRDFPDQYDQKPEKDLHEFYVHGRQKETIAMMSWISSQPFVLSGNLHAGSVVASYPYDDTGGTEDCCVDAPTPDNALFKELATLYARNHRTMHIGSICKGDHFPGGITNGAHWYNVQGGMQDYNYLHSNCFELTFELSCCKYPAARTLPREWNNNKESLLSYIEATHWGVKGLVKSDLDGSGIPGAIISIKNLAHNVTTSKRGEYWRLLLPGKYELQASAPGFEPSKPVIATVVEESTTQIDFSLTPVPYSVQHHYSGAATSADLLKPSDRLQVIVAPARDIHGFVLPAQFKHHNYDEMLNLMSLISKNFPNITRLYSAGRSVQSRELLVLEISDNPGVHELGEPEVKLVANQHGNEVVGREMLLLLAQWLTQNYHSDPRAGQIINTTRLHLMPSMNPDGYNKSSQSDKTLMQGRENMHNKDLNRNFPDQYKTNDMNQRAEPETVSVMAWTQSLPFVLSANLHGGSLVVNYPYDDNAPGQTKGQANISPDDKVFKHLARTYAKKNPMMVSGKPCGLRSDENFKDGITNGALWYEVTGGMQDWNYVKQDCFDVTIEMGCTKFPPASELPKFWEENRESLLSYIDQAHIGVSGFVLDTAGTPIPGSYVTVDGIDHITKVANSGDYWRLLTAGKYYISASAVGYSRTSAVVTVPEISPGQPGHISLNLTLSAEHEYAWVHKFDFDLEENVQPQNYSSNSELSAAMGAIENKYPSMSEFEAGTNDVSQLIHSLSVQKQSGSPDEGKIKILLLGGLRASQPMGRELIIRLANHIMAGVEHNDTTCQYILNTSSLLFAPGVDRGFIVTKDNCHAQPNDQEVESKFVKDGQDLVSRALRKLITDFEADLVINIAGGAYSVGTPNSASDTDLQLFSSLQRAFSNEHPILSKEKFLCDVTNHTESSLEDYIFKKFGIPAVTVRLGCCCYPPIWELVPMWKDNLNPFMNLLRSSLQGIQGQIVDSYGTPIRAAHIKMTGGSQLRVGYSENGARFRVLLAAGTHRLTVWAEGYEGREVSVEVAEGKINKIQIRLENEGTNGTTGVTFRNFAQNQAWMKHLQQEYPNLVRIISLGVGVSALQLGLLNTAGQETVPRVALLVDHPTEMNCVPREVAMRFAEFLVSRFGSDEQATRMLKNSHIYILPLPVESGNVSWTNEDTVSWLHDNGPVVTAILSTGALGVALPSSNVLGKTADRQVLQQMAEAYVRNNAVMKLRPASHIANCLIKSTQGATWDVEPGGLLDSSYNKSSTLPLSIYLSCEKTPAPTDITRIWRENREALITLLGDDLYRGISGFVLDEFTGSGIVDAIILVDTDSKDALHHKFSPRPNSGAYWRPLSLGEHAITAEAPGYHSSTKLVNVAISGNKHEDVIFRLVKDDRVLGIPKMAVIMSITLLILSCVTCSLLWYAIRNRFKKRLSKDIYTFQALRTTEYDIDYDDDGIPDIPSKNGSAMLDRAYRPRPYRDISSSDDEVDVLVRAGRDDIVINGDISP